MRTTAIGSGVVGRLPLYPTAAVLLCIGMMVPGVSPATAETLYDAMVRAYRENPTLNAQRTGVLATQENLARARAGYRPKISATGDAGRYSESNRYADGTTFDQSTVPRGVGLSLDQNLFDGFRTGNSVRQARSLTREAEAATLKVEQNTLFAAATAYMDVLADTAILDRVRRNIAALGTQLKQSRERHGFGDVTRTDVAQVESRLASAKAQENVAEANLKTSVANYRQATGVAPGRLSPARPPDELIPSSVDAVIATAVRDNPGIEAASHGIEAARLQPDIIRGERLPNVALSGVLARRHDVDFRGHEQSAASLVARISIPVYDGGEIAARASQAKHIAAQRALEATALRDQIQAAAASRWAQLQAAKGRLHNQRTQLKAATTALTGIRQQWALGDRTMREVLDAEQEFLTAEVNLIVAERDRVVASYALVQVLGRLTLDSLKGVRLTADKDTVFSMRTFSQHRPPPEKPVALRCDRNCGAVADTWALRLTRN